MVLMSLQSDLVKLDILSKVEIRSSTVLTMPAV